MKATIRGRVLASDDEIVMIEGNVCFPPGAVTHELLGESETPYACPWKGRSQYFNAVIDVEVVDDAGWSHPASLASAVKRAGTAPVPRACLSGTPSRRARRQVQRRVLGGTGADPAHDGTGAGGTVES